MDFDTAPDSDVPQAPSARHRQGHDANLDAQWPVSGTMSAMSDAGATTPVGSSCGTSTGQRVFAALMGICFLGLSLLFSLMAVGDGAAGLAFVAALCPIGYANLQAGFHTRIEWTPSGVVFRRVWVTRHLPWEAVTQFDASGAGACVLASRPEVGSWPISSPNLQVIRTDVLGARSSPATRTAVVLNEYREHMPAAVPGAQIATTVTRPGAVALAWLVAQAVLLCASVVLIASR